MNETIAGGLAVVLACIMTIVFGFSIIGII